jgi:hypothetical protein
MASSLTSSHAFVARQLAPNDLSPRDPNLFTTDDIAAALGLGGGSSVAASTADSKAESASGRASVADSKAVSDSLITSVADSKAISVSGNTSIADSKAESVAAALVVDIGASVASSQAVSAATRASVADSKAISDSVNISIADSKGRQCRQRGNGRNGQRRAQQGR